MTISRVASYPAFPSRLWWGDALLIRQVMKRDLPALEWDGEYAHFRRLFAEAQRRAERGEAVLWVADLPGTGIIGQLFIQLDSPRTDLADGFERAYAYAFRVRPGFRRIGIGSRLMETAETDLKNRSFKQVVLNVAKNNRDARRLYERLGYQVVGTDAGIWSYIDHRGRRQEVCEPAWLMLKRL
jgi:ribosomal protein S18 acetylase RimI-like enzyme